MEDVRSKKASICTEEKKTKTGIFFNKCVEESFVSMNEKGGGKKSPTPTPQQFTHQEEHIENSPWKEKVEKP